MGMKNWEQAFFVDPVCPHDEARVLAFAAALQAHLGIVVTACVFIPGKSGREAAFPCALVTIEPFVPGGLRRLALNARNALVHQVAVAHGEGMKRALGGGPAAARWQRDVEAALEIGSAMVHSGSWPIDGGFDLMPRMSWMSALGLICGTSKTRVWPVLHDTSSVQRRDEPPPSALEAIAIWPRRVSRIHPRMDRRDPSRVQQYDVHHVGERWMLREGRLEREWAALRGEAACDGRQAAISWRRVRGLLPHTRAGVVDGATPRSPPASSASVPLRECGLMTFAPELPILALADELRHRGVPPTSAVPAAAAALTARDRLFALSLFFGVPMIDRTRTLHGALRTTTASPPPPTPSEVLAYRRRIFADAPGWNAARADWEEDGARVSHGGEPASIACERELDAAMMTRARELWRRADAASPMLEVRVMWSGGIDSTAALVCLLRAASDEPAEVGATERLRRLVVVLDDESRAEYPLFYSRFIAGRLREEARDGRSVSAIGSSAIGASRGLTVTGELGDQLFGSDTCAKAFPRAARTDDAACPALPLGAPREPELDGSHHFAPGLACSWQETLIPALAEMGLLAGDDAAAWVAWAAPQLARAPFPIVSTHDMLWWLNFSCKWQIVALRCTHDGGIPLYSTVTAHRPLGQRDGSAESEAGEARAEGDMPGDGTARPGEIHSGAAAVPWVAHFYEDRQLELWASVREFHARKFADLTQWRTYKMPLKVLIAAFTEDEAYRADKEKVASLNFGVDDAHQDEDNVTATLGVLAPIGGGGDGDADGDGDRSTLARFGVTARYLRCGTTSLREANGRLRALLRPEFADLVRGAGTGLPREVTVNPWPALSMLPAAGEATGAPVAVAYRETVGPVDAFQLLAPDFATTDERQRRTFNPVTATTLVGKCAALLPPSLCRGRIVLDLGACLGAMCHWALCAGATRAVAVEVQPDFCARATEMLAAAAHTWPPLPASVAAAAGDEERYSVVQAGVREFLAGCEDDSFDVVVGAGLLHCFVDPVDIYLQMCRCARVAVVVEVDQVEVIQSAVLVDGDPPHSTARGAAVAASRKAKAAVSLARGASPAPHTADGAALLQLAPRALVNRSGEDASFAGLSVVPSRALLELVAASFGFEPTRVRLAPHPTRADDVLTYAGLRRFQATPRRFFLRCERRANAPTVRGMPRSLEAAVTSGAGAVHVWSKPVSWWSFSGAGAGAAVSAALPDGEAPAVDGSVVAAAASKARKEEVLPRAHAPGHWAFDSDVASRFDHEARCHIPDYLQVVDVAADAVTLALSAAGVDARRRSAIEVGCAVGYSMRVLLERKVFAAVHGVDSSPSMIASCRANLATAGHAAVAEHNVHETATLPPADRFDPPLGAVFANWTLHFIRGVDEREEYLRRIYRALEPGGVLVLTEKTRQDAATRALYHQWKALQGVDAATIAAKEAALEGVLIALPAQWYDDTLERAGFTDVTVLWSRFGFVTWLAHKPQHAATAATAAARVEAGTLNANGGGWGSWLSSLSVLRSTPATTAAGAVDKASVAAASDTPHDRPPPAGGFLCWPDFPLTTTSDGSASSSDGRAVRYESAAGEEAPFSYQAWGSAAAASSEEGVEHCWRNADGNRSVYGFVTHGPAALTCLGAARFECTLGTNMYFACPGDCELRGGAGILALAPNGPNGAHRALFTVGGPVEAGHGRLPYIDGCTDTLLLSPPRRGAPCLNHLHFPTEIRQTRHTHPSGRAGVVIAGEGVCVFPDASTEGGEQRVQLRPGTAFVIPADAPHAFETTEEAELDVIAFHPDSDFGPSPVDHPMVNRTVVGGVSASQLPAIRTADWV